MQRFLFFEKRLIFPTMWHLRTKRDILICAHLKRGKIHISIQLMPNYILRLKYSWKTSSYASIYIYFSILKSILLLKLAADLHYRIPSWKKKGNVLLHVLICDYPPNLPPPTLTDPQGSSCANYALCAGLLFWQWSVQLHDWHGNSPVNTWPCASPSVHSAQPDASRATEMYS